MPQQTDAMAWQHCAPWTGQTVRELQVSLEGLHCGRVVWVTRQCHDMTCAAVTKFFLHRLHCTLSMHALLMWSHISDRTHFDGMVTYDYYTNKNIVLCPGTIRVNLCWILCSSSLSFLQWGDHAAVQNSSCGRTSDLYDFNRTPLLFALVVDCSVDNSKHFIGLWICLSTLLWCLHVFSDNDSLFLVRPLQVFPLPCDMLVRHYFCQHALPCIYWCWTTFAIPLTTATR